MGHHVTPTTHHSQLSYTKEDILLLQHNPKINRTTKRRIFALGLPRPERTLFSRPSVRTKQVNTGQRRQDWRGSGYPPVQHPTQPSKQQNTCVSHPPLLNSKTCLNICTWNVRSLHQIGKTELLIREIQRFKWDIIGLCETRWTGNGTKCIDNFHIVFSGHNSLHVGGVGLVLSKGAHDSMINVNYVNNRIISARFKGLGFCLTLIQVYAPTAQSDECEIDEFYSLLQNELNRVDKNDIVLIQGDWNAKVGQDHETWNETIGKYSYGNSNERGVRLLEFCTINRLCISNTFFKHKDSRKWTWNHPNGHSKNMIDLILINNRWKNCILNCRSYPSADVGSDHQLVICKLRLKLKNRRKCGNTKPVKHAVQKLRENDVKQRYQLELRKAFEESRDETRTLNEAAERLSEILKTTADKVIGFERPKRKPWISEDTLNLVDQRREIKHCLPYRPELKSSYNRLTHEIRRSLDQDQEKWYNTKCTEIESLQRTHQTRTLHQKIKEVTNGTKIPTKTLGIKSKDNITLTTTEETLDRWKEYCSDLYNFDLKVSENTLDNLWQGQIQDETPNILFSEVETAIKKLKRFKSPGVDGVCSELLLDGGTTVKKEMFKICEMAWEQEEFPEIWTKSIIITLPKKGDLKLCENYRTISLIPHTSKVLLEIIRSRLKPFIEVQMDETQAGFRPGRSTIEQIFVWKQLAERYLEMQDGEMVNIFIDFKKAFDRVWHLGLMRILEHYNIPRKLLELVRSLYNQATSAVRCGMDISGWFKQSVGVRQGCILSPDLFNLFLEHVLREALDAYQDGCRMNGYRITNLRFADDIALLGETQDECQRQLNAIENASERFGLEISAQKTKGMLVSNEPADLTIHLSGGGAIEQVEHFKYLGTEVTGRNDTLLDIRCRTAQATVSLSKLQAVWSNGRISTATKLRLWNCLVMPVALYGCENWVLSMSAKRKIQAFEMKCLRRVLGISWQQHVTNSEVARRSGIDEGNIIKMIERKQRAWLGKILRMDDNKLPKLALQAHQLGRRRRGRPKSTWLPEVLRGKKLSQCCNDVYNNQKWKAFVAN